MKKIILLISTAIISAIIFNSCSTTGVTLTKRHYRSGYNLEISSAQTKPAEKGKNDVQPEAVSKPVEPVTEPEYASVSDNGEKSYLKHKPFSFDLKDNEQAESETSETKVEHKNVLQKMVKASTALTKVSTVKKTISKTFKRADDSHSLGGLIWTLAGILLVLWLISLLTGGWGLGNFIHIFLVVALILVLLRLIHVI
ncbi:MAG: lmo0937 family membrane protein [Bacteroidia bacterium]|jgi:hypothetical protein